MAAPASRSPSASMASDDRGCRSDRSGSACRPSRPATGRVGRARSTGRGRRVLDARRCPTTSTISWRRCRRCSARPTPPTTLRLGALVLRQRLQAPGGARQGTGHDGRAVRRAARRSASAPGGLRTDYEQSGIPYDSPGVRISRFDRGPADHQVGVRSAEPFSFAGEHYTITELQRYAEAGADLRRRS